MTDNKGGAMLRWVAGLSLMALALLPGVVSFYAWPYESWGEPPQVRSRIALLSSNLAWAALMFLFGAAATVYSSGNSRGWKAALFTAALFVFMALSAARIIWIQFWVLPPFAP
jgi:hypothetical protein